MANTLFITGASTGIGKSTALYFKAKGWNVAATMRDTGPHDDLRAAGVLTLALDVTKPETIQPAVAAAIEKFGRVDALCNNAGYGAMGPFEAASNEQIERQYATNVTGLMFVTREFLSHFRANQSGVIINISSVGGVAAFPLFTLYHGTKWAIEGFSESLNYELNPFGIRVKIVEPGRIKTDFGSRSMDFLRKPGLTAYDDFIAKFMANRSAMSAAGPELVAEVIWQAATDGTDQLRYIAGDDAKTIIETRKKLSQDEYYAMIRERMLA
jgi:NAD(P)-dependent dehydrogenase (short-subunit alcohol dehydrogenase family)